MSTATAWALSREARSRVDLIDTLAFIAAVGILLIYSQVWIVPIFGHNADPSTSGMIRNMFLPAYAAGLVLLALAPDQTFAAVWRQPFLIACLFLATASILWSVHPDITARRSFAVWFTSIGGVVIGARFRWAQLAEVLASNFLILGVLSFIAGALLPKYGVMTELFPGAWRGFWQEKNNLGGLMALGFMTLSAAAILNPARRWLWWAGAALAIFLILMSTSKTSLVSAVLGLGLTIMVMLIRRGPIFAVAFTWLFTVVTSILVSVIVFAPNLFFNLLGKDATLTGRTKIWAAIMNRIELRPWSGYGYAAVWDDFSGWGPAAFIIKQAGFVAHHAHNSWLEFWLGLGLPGLVLFAAYYLQTLFGSIYQAYRQSGAILALPYLVVYGLMTMTESISMIYNDLRWVIFTAISVKVFWPDPPEPDHR
jgi:exopolysaccharide production protein ExoQ